MVGSWGFAIYDLRFFDLRFTIYDCIRRFRYLKAYLVLCLATGGSSSRSTENGNPANPVNPVKTPSLCRCVHNSIPLAVNVICRITLCLHLNLKKQLTSSDGCKLLTSSAPALRPFAAETWKRDVAQIHMNGASTADLRFAIAFGDLRIDWFRNVLVAVHMAAWRRFHRNRPTNALRKADSYKVGHPMVGRQVAAKYLNQQMTKCNRKS